jgi:hypothetical protein
MNEIINNLRLDAGIAQLKDDPRLVVIDREGNAIDPLIGLEKFAELIVRECIEQIKLECEDFENGNCFHNKDLWNLVTREYGINKERGFNPIGMSIHFESIIKHHFGVEE